MKPGPAQLQTSIHIKLKLVLQAQLTQEVKEAHIKLHLVDIQACTVGLRPGYEVSQADLKQRSDAEVEAVQVLPLLPLSDTNIHCRTKAGKP